MTVGERIKHLRESIGYSIARLEKESKVANISRIENNVTLPSIESVKLLCSFFDVTSDWLIFGADSSPQEKKAEARKNPDLSYMIEWLHKMAEEGPERLTWAKITFEDAFEDYIKKNKTDPPNRAKEEGA